MGRTLIIAEKPSVAEDIARVVGASKKGAHAWEGDQHVVSWAIGHLLEFVPPEGYDDAYKRWRLRDLPIVPEQFLLTPTKKNEKQLKAVQKFLKAKDVDSVVNACDAGREGELIFREIYRWSGSDKPVRRLWLQSMTPASIRDSIEHPRAQDEVQGLADAADCRAEADWLIGMNATRALTVRLRSQRDKVVWSAGRVQTATLAMVVRREREILDHEPRPYWTVQATFDVGHRYVAQWFDPKGEGQRDRIFDPAERDRLIALLQADADATATETRKDARESSPPLLDLTTLQREANRRFGFSARRTLSTAQALYEQHKLITYPRTDSRALPEDYRGNVQQVIQWLTSESAYAPHARRLQADGLAYTQRNFDDRAVSDHFAIIPTGAGDPRGLKGDEAKVFDLVVRRFLAAFHPPAILEEVERLTDLKGESFRTRRRVLKVPGWRAVFDKEAGDPDEQLPPLPTPEGTAARLVEHTVDEKLTRPPARLTEAGLLGLMETAGKEVDDERLAQVLKDTGGLGTPATRAEIIETLIAREYADRCTGLDNRKALRATARGIRLIDALERIDLPRLTSAELTAELEDQLRAIERGKAQREDYMQEMRAWTRTIVDRVRDFKFDTLYEGTAPLCQCPHHPDQGVFENLRTFACALATPEGGCTFVLWKEVSGRYLDRRAAEQLCRDGKTPPKAGFFTRDGREFEASLVREPDGRVRAHSGDAVDAGPVEVADIAPCPHHEGLRIRRTALGFRCDGHGEQQCPWGKKACSLNLPLVLCQKELTEADVVGLVGPDRKSSLITGFISRRNRPFDATLHLEDGGRLRWEFPPREGRKGKSEDEKSFPVDPTPLGPCPRKAACPGQGQIVETATHFQCSASGCTVSIPREVCKREVTRAEVQPLVDRGETPLIEGFISKGGKPFAAQLYLKRTGRYGFRFGERE